MHLKKLLLRLERNLQLIFAKFNIFMSIDFRRFKSNKRKVLVNIGCGKTPLIGFANCDIESSHYHLNLAPGIIRYDMRQDNLPFGNESVDGIYCSHVIEHVEVQYVKRFFSESHRVLNRGGVLRIAVPDSKFLFRMWKEEPNYFGWHKFFPEDHTGTKSFVRLVAGARTTEPDFGLESDISSYKYNELMALLEEGQSFDSDSPQLHISNWDYEKVVAIGCASGFTRIIESKRGGSVFEGFQRPDIDTTHSQMSLYVDLVKK